MAAERFSTVQASPMGASTADLYRRSLFNDGQNVAGVHRRSSGGRYFLYDSLFWRLDFVLHFHGFDYDNTLTGFDIGILCDKQAHNAAGHGSQDFSGALFVSGTFLA